MRHHLGRLTNRAELGDQGVEAWGGSAAEQQSAARRVNIACPMSQGKRDQMHALSVEREQSPIEGWIGLEHGDQWLGRLAQRGHQIARRRRRYDSMGTLGLRHGLA